jgi:hypothetical protein
MSNLCDVLNSRSKNPNEVRLAELIYNVSILAEMVTEKIPEIINDEFNKIQYQLDEIRKRVDGMSAQQYTTTPIIGPLPIPGQQYLQTQSGPPPLPGNMPPGYQAPKPMPQKSTKATMIDELNQKLKNRKID